MENNQVPSSSSSVSYVYQPPLRPFELSLLADGDIEFVEDYMSNRGVTQSYFAFEPYNSTFVDITSHDFYKVCLSRNFVSEKPINRFSFASNQLLHLLSNSRILPTVTNLSAYTIEIIREFYSNLRICIHDQTSPMFHRVFVRNRFYDFSPKVINQYFGIKLLEQTDIIDDFDIDEIARTLSGGLLKTWPNDNFPSNVLTSKFKSLFRIGITNWIPTLDTNEVSLKMGKFLYAISIGKPINVGSIIFDEIIKCCETFNHSDPIIFPRTIYGILLDQYIPSYNDDTIVVPNDELYAFINKRKKVFDESIDANHILYEAGQQHASSAKHNGFEIQQVQQVLCSDISKATKLRENYIEEVVRLDMEITVKNRLLGTLDGNI